MKAFRFPLLFFLLFFLLESLTLLLEVQYYEDFCPVSKNIDFNIHVYSSLLFFFSSNKKKKPSHWPGTGEVVARVSFVALDYVRFNMADVEKVEYWAKRWEEGDSPWHKTFVQPFLEQHYQKLIPSSEQPTKTRIFVPLCGKSLDMIWLEEKGFQVVGVEGVESVVAAFFQENNISFEVKPSPENPEIKCYHGIDKDITIYSVDLFKVATDTLGGSFDAVWDRGSLAAIGLYTENRGKRYADLLASLLRPNGRILVENHVYIDDPGPRSGPSHVPPEVLHDLFGDKFDIATLDVEDSPTKGPYNHSYNLMTLK